LLAPGFEVPGFEPGFEVFGLDPGLGVAGFVDPGVVDPGVVAPGVVAPGGLGFAPGFALFGLFGLLGLSGLFGFVVPGEFGFVGFDPGVALPVGGAPVFPVGG